MAIDPLDRSLLARSQDPAAQLQVPAMGDLAGDRVIPDTHPNGYPPPVDAYSDKLRVFVWEAFNDGAGIAASASWTYKIDGYYPDFLYVVAQGTTNLTIALYLNGTGNGTPIYLGPGGWVKLPIKQHTQVTIVNLSGTVAAKGNLYLLDAKTADHFGHRWGNT